MTQGTRTKRRWLLSGLVLPALLALASPAAAQTTSAARCVKATLLQTSVLGITLTGTTTILAATPDLPSGVTGALQASAITGSVPPLLSGDSLHATVVGLADGATSEASLGSLGMFVAGNTISADFVMAQARSGAGAGVLSEIDGLVVNGTRVTPTGAPGQSVPIVGGVLVLNEQQSGPSGLTLTAMHLIIGGVADVLVGTASAEGL